jgi:protoheme IX farnesyltransferase
VERNIWTFYETDKEVSRMSKIVHYITLASPRITLLVMLTAFAGMWVASGGIFQESIFIWCLLGIGLASSGASAYNNWYDRNIDRQMSRTDKRALPSEKISSRGALIFATCLILISILIMILFVNTLSALLTAFAVFTYSCLYTALLKGRTPLATEIGGISGALPPVIGWSAVRGEIGFEAVLLFAIMFFWQPPHFWHLAIRHNMDYTRAGIPTLPSVAGEEFTKLKSLQYIIALLSVSMLPYFIGMFGNIYMFTVSALGIIYFVIAFPGLKFKTTRRVFHYSIVYMSALMAAIIIDVKYHH